MRWLQHRALLGWSTTRLTASSVLSDLTLFTMRDDQQCHVYKGRPRKPLERYNREREETTISALKRGSYQMPDVTHLIFYNTARKPKSCAPEWDGQVRPKGASSWVLRRVFLDSPELVGCPKQLSQDFSPKPSPSGELLVWVFHVQIYNIFITVTLYLLLVYIYYST